MRKSMKWLVTILIVCLLFNAAGTLAAKEEDYFDLEIKQVTRKALIYSEPSKRSDTYGYIAGGMAVLSLDLENGFTQVQVGPFNGFVETKYLIAPDESVTVVGIESVKANTQLVGLPDVRYISKLSKGQTVYVLTSLGEFVFIKANGNIGFVRGNSLIPYDEKSPVIEWVEMLKRTDIKQSEGKDAPRLARANKGTQVAVLKKLDDERAIVRHGEIIGVMSLENTKPVDSKASTPSPTPSLSTAKTPAPKTSKRK